MTAQHPFVAATIRHFLSKWVSRTNRSIAQSFKTMRAFPQGMKSLLVSRSQTELYTKMFLAWLKRSNSREKDARVPSKETKLMLPSWHVYIIANAEPLGLPLAYVFSLHHKRSDQYWYVYYEQADPRTVRPLRGIYRLFSVQVTQPA